MVMYSAYMALIVCFVLVIVLHAWFVRRLTAFRDRVHALKEEYGRLQAELASLAETVRELERGKESNALSIQALEREIEELREKIRLFLGEHPELREEFGKAVPEVREKVPAAETAAGQGTREP